VFKKPHFVMLNSFQHLIPNLIRDKFRVTLLGQPDLRYKIFLRPFFPELFGGTVVVVFGSTADNEV